MERIAELANQCVQCGLCLQVCPTYALDRNEAESPRGRIAIASALARGLADPTTELRAHLDHCLGCLNCETVCPDSRCCRCRGHRTAAARPAATCWNSPHAPRNCATIRCGKAPPLDPQLLLSSNIGCRSHLAAGIDAQGLPWPTRHPLTLLAQQLEQPYTNQENP